MPGMGRYLPIGFDGGRQEFAVRHNGELFADKAQAQTQWKGRRKPALARAATSLHQGR